MDSNSEPDMYFKDMRVLVVDDEPGILKIWERILSKRGCDFKLLPDGNDVIELVEGWDPDVVLLDIQLPKASGMDLLQEIKRRDLPSEVVMMTAFATVDSALEALKQGAFDYLTKPFENIDDVIHTVFRAGRHKRLLRRLHELDGGGEPSETFEGMIGASPEMKRVFETIKLVARSESSVLIRGESGTGKELVARAIHRHSPRKASTFLAVNCSALSETLLESELFGHEKGAFTGASTARQGLFEATGGGTLLLDEVGDIPVVTQPKLLRVLQEGEVRRVGGNEVRKVDVRVLTATNRDLARAVKEGTFREDLYYRLNVIAIDLPPLRKRIQDLYLLATHFVRSCAGRAGKEVDCIQPEAMQVFEKHDWPGNIRELENVIERAIVLSRGREIGLGELPEKMRDIIYEPRLSGDRIANLPYQEAKHRAVSDFDRRYLVGMLTRTGGNISRAAKMANMDRSNFRRLMKRYDIDPQYLENDENKGTRQH